MPSRSETDTRSSCTSDSCMVTVVRTQPLTTCKTTSSAVLCLSYGYLRHLPQWLRVYFHTETPVERSRSGTQSCGRRDARSARLRRAYLLDMLALQRVVRSPKSTREIDDTGHTVPSQMQCIENCRQVCCTDRNKGDMGGQSSSTCC